MWGAGMRVTVADLAQRLRVDPKFTNFLPYQLDCFEHWSSSPTERLCLYYRTGAGKSITSLCCVPLRGLDEALVIAPPVTHPDWVALGKMIGVDVTCVSHAKFRMKDFQVRRTVSLIVDEFHLLGGHGGKGWAKLDRLARGLKAPLIICSATPNYNDAERVYCIRHVMEDNLKGGFLDFLAQNCNTRTNPYGMTPLVDENNPFKLYKSAEEYLASLPYVVYVPDLHDPQVVDIRVQTSVPAEFEEYGLNRRKGRINASMMEARHQEKYLNLIGDDGLIRPHVYDQLNTLVGNATTPVLLFCMSSTVADALADTCYLHHVRFGVVTGKTPAKQKALLVNAFRKGQLDVLIGTATLGTGTDGFDKVCDTLILVDDTDDDACRKQLLGRILPRGEDVDASGKQFFRLVF